MAASLVIPGGILGLDTAAFPKAFAFHAAANARLR